MARPRRRETGRHRSAPPWTRASPQVNAASVCPAARSNIPSWPRQACAQQRGPLTALWALEESQSGLVPQCCCMEAWTAESQAPPYAPVWLRLTTQAESARAASRTGRVHHLWSIRQAQHPFPAVRAARPCGARRERGRRGAAGRARRVLPAMRAARRIELRRARRAAGAMARRARAYGRPPRRGARLPRAGDGCTQPYKPTAYPNTILNPGVVP